MTSFLLTGNVPVGQAVIDLRSIWRFLGIQRIQMHDFDADKL